MAKRISEAAKLCECESEDCATELPLKKRLKLLQDDYENEAHSSNSSSPMIRLAEVACALAAAAAAEISDDDGDHHDDSSVTTTEDDQSTAGSVSRFPRRTTVQQKPVKSVGVGPSVVPTRPMPLRAPARFLPPSQRRPVTKYNFCVTGKPLSCPPKLFKSKHVLGDIDATLA